MALSYQSSWETLAHLNPEIGGAFHEPQSEVADALLGFFCDPIDASTFPIDSLFDSSPESYFYAETETETVPLPSLSHSSLSAPSILALTPDLYPPCDKFDLYRCPKRPRSCGDLFRPSNLVFEQPGSYIRHIAAGAMMGGCRSSDFLSEFAAAPPLAVGMQERKAGSGCLSAQSAAARERRKRISEKTQELGKLIPGGNKMNTAEMFQSAYKYVSFLQAQVGILSLMGSIQERGKVPLLVEQQLQLLLESTTIQEKLYGEGNCLVPNKIVDTMAKDKEIKSNMLVSRDLDRFIESMR
ncbi:uncharacterized protein LOC109713852 isoform X2 [Ananas comosus]|nr:uncharacterized protein LOC109713852 isoform X2 [Ananas comosus]XP_020093686.1 uncharacterized protein LOC109713852 isoform X2 [Ananas comosus]XP_020093687.1 uncharacterized protein LOC109713852 isoform X2 [Ananas comosus]OAY73981.1 Transcription factor bHLH53 [Ananas comosus]